MRARPLVCFLLFISCSSGSSMPPLAESPLLLEAPTVIEIIDTKRPIVHVSFGGNEQLRFLVDTGAESTIIDARAAEDVGLRVANYAGTSSIEGSGTKTIEVARYAHLLSLQIGELEVPECHITAIEDKVLDDLELAGIIGQDILSRLVVIFDMENRKLHFLPGESDQAAISEYLSNFDLGVGTWRVEEVEFKPRPFLPLRIESLEGEAPEMLIDTGSDTTSFPAVVSDALELTPLGERTYQGLGGTYQGKLYRLDDFRMSGFSLSFEFHGTPQPYGVLGMNVLGKFVFLLDGAAGTCWLHHRTVQPNQD